MANRGGIIAGRVPRVETRNNEHEFQLSRKQPEIAADVAGVSRNIARPDALPCGRAARRKLKGVAWILAIAALAAAVGAPVAAQAQVEITTGVARAPAVVVESGPGIAVEQRPAFREYIVRERVPSYTIPDRVVVGTVLPEAGVTYYDVPQRFGATRYRYTVVNGETVLVEPRSRRIVEVVD